MRQNNIHGFTFYMGGLGLDRTDVFQKFCGSGLDRIQFLRIRIGLGLKNLTVRSSLTGSMHSLVLPFCKHFVCLGFLLFSGVFSR